jgi:DNA-binding MarR family transcriptional regulator/GNAT superfamily N-acetyltransferase
VLENAGTSRVETVRRFNRFYTRKIGVLQEHLLQSDFSLTEARVLYELAQRDHTTATELRTALGLDAGYLSRILRGLRKRNLIDRRPSTADGRQTLLSLSPNGQTAFAKLNGESRAEIGHMLDELSPDRQQRIVDAMSEIETILGAEPARHSSAYILRPPGPGDLGWVVEFHGRFYAQEYGWDEKFEALVASIVAKFVQHFDPKRERCWIAELNGENVGSVFVVKRSQTIAQLRLLLVDPKARGLGIGARLVEECIRFARQTGYRKMVLWTNSVLHSARRIYEANGFQMTKEEPHNSFGHDLIGQTWTLRL